MKEKPITATMAACLAYAHDHDGILHRYEGGRWAKRGWSGCSEKFNASTVQGLVDRGEMEYTEWKAGTHAPFPIVAKMTKKATTPE